MDQRNLNQVIAGDSQTSGQSSTGQACRVCLQPANHPAIVRRCAGGQQFSCQHLFCLLCIADCAKTDHRCPDCRHPYDQIVFDKKSFCNLEALEVNSDIIPMVDIERILTQGKATLEDRCEAVNLSDRVRKLVKSLEKIKTSGISKRDPKLAVECCTMADVWKKIYKRHKNEVDFIQTYNVLNQPGDIEEPMEIAD